MAVVMEGAARHFEREAMPVPSCLAARPAPPNDSLVSLNRPATMSSTVSVQYTADNAVDGDTSTTRPCLANACAQSSGGDKNPWW
jgi:hypothetical protein